MSLLDALGPVMLDIAGPSLSAEDRERLLHPLVGGVILFTRNYQSPEQLAALTGAIHGLREPRLLIAVDHEGGRVQRFRDGFTRLPPMRELGHVWDRNAARARHLAQEAGFVIGAELRACGVDFSFAPVLDLDYGESAVIGSRAFHREPQAVGELAHALVQGMRRAGMAAVGKHFPGHGFVRADSHLELPVDERSYADIRMNDLLPFAQLIDLGLAGIMPAHVVYPRVDDQPAGFSTLWLQRVLREELRFSGIVFSDDLCMEGACVAGGARERALAALSAGCDMALVCNHPEAADEILNGLAWNMPAASLARMARMHGRLPAPTWTVLREDSGYARALRDLDGVGVREGDLPLGS